MPTAPPTARAIPREAKIFLTPALLNTLVTIPVPTPEAVPNNSPAAA